MFSPEQYKGWFNIDARTDHEVLSINRENKSVLVKNGLTGETYVLFLSFPVVLKKATITWFFLLVLNPLFPDFRAATYQVYSSFATFQTVTKSNRGLLIIMQQMP